jgi:acyl-CoA hydrolase
MSDPDADSPGAGSDPTVGASDATLADSHTEMTEMLLPNDTNNLGRALGGAVLHWMDVCGAIAGMRFSSRQVVTASMDHVDFIAPIEMGEVVVIEGYVFNTGRTSLDVKVEVHAENPRTGEERRTTASYFTFVALDEEGRPTEVPDLTCPTDAEEALRTRAVEGRREQLREVVERYDL